MAMAFDYASRAAKANSAGRTEQQRHNQFHEFGDWGAQPGRMPMRTGRPVDYFIKLSQRRCTLRSF
jgi:hypothetical protein